MPEINPFSALPDELSLCTVETAATASEVTIGTATNTAVGLADGEAGAVMYKTMLKEALRRQALSDAVALATLEAGGKAVAQGGCRLLLGRALVIGTGPVGWVAGGLSTAATIYFDYKSAMWEQNSAARIHAVFSVSISSLPPIEKQDFPTTYSPHEVVDLPAAEKNTFVAPSIFTSWSDPLIYRDPLIFPDRMEDPTPPTEGGIVEKIVAGSKDTMDADLRKKVADLLQQGRDLQRQGRLNEAYRTYSTAVKEDPTAKNSDIQILALLEMGQINLSDTNYFDAAYALNRVLRLNPDHLVARGYYIQAMIGLNQEMSAIQQSDLALSQVEKLKAKMERTDPSSLPARDRKGMEKVLDIGKNVEKNLRGIVDKATGEKNISVALFAVKVLIRHVEEKENLLVLQEQLQKEVDQKRIKSKLPEEYTRKDLVELSKTLGHALRHAPWEYELEMSEEGWVYLEHLIASLRLRPQWALLDRAVIEKTIAAVSQGRYEIKDNLIRAHYGHAEIVPKIVKEKGEPPTILYHGTDESMLPSILQSGLQKGLRQYVHLSSTPEKALQIASRKGNKPVLLVISTEDLLKRGYSFYHGNEEVWLVDEVPADLVAINTGIN